ncbi:fungal transcriptional regulatory-like protein [Apodospora peruviana]|uniref:Fungal transcriptional regulatory-like protein n=1 Tax=Apodospora peruviana TaxID=516989 RepID=A0AAE0IK49_9PEZI|nr:fungal transcriptional regulatory-like protein [Apodospora peruviana]
MSRPQVGIERLPTRRLSNEPRESMNCKSCRKRKIKCNRLRPACEACQVFQCPCIYDAVPKKRGPKTDVLEALLKRVDGLEAKLKEKKTDTGTMAAEGTPSDAGEGPSSAAQAAASVNGGEDTPNQPSTGTARGQGIRESPESSPNQQNEPSPRIEPDALLDTYFTRFHAKPFFILDESTLRQRLQLNQVPRYLIHAVFAVAARYTLHPGGYQFAVRLSEDYAAQSRSEIDTDEPSIDALQALMLLVTAFTAAGKGKKAYMLLTNAVGMAMALELHREIDFTARVTPVERETRRRLFWSCYLLDRFMACGSKRPSLIGDKTILLRLPCWSPNPATLPIEGEFFQSGSNLQYFQGAGKRSQGSSGMLIDISRILGTTNRYLAAGGVKGDSHFPWHSLSNLSKIRQDLDIWASGAEDVFSSLDTLFGQADSTVLVLSKLIYHLVHCLIYRPFLPIDLAELAGTGQHQSWQIESTNMCFLHANAIAELVELGKQTASIEWPAFVGYCICTAGTVHIHGAHYSRLGNAAEMNVFSSSADFLSREMQQLSELRYAWASVQHQRETLQGIYSAHSTLVKSLADNPMRYSPVFHLEDFFDRYSNIGGPGGQTFSFDAANLSLSDVIVDFTTDTYPGHDLYAPRINNSDPGLGRPSLKRKNTAPLGRKRPDLKNLISISSNMNSLQSSSLSTPSHTQHSFHTQSMPPQSSPGMLNSPASLAAHHELHGQSTHMSSIQESLGEDAAAIASAGFSLPQQSATLQSGISGHGPGIPPSLSNNAAPFSPTFSFAQINQQSTSSGTSGTQQGNYDPMFGDVPTNAFSSPTPWQGGDDGGKRSASAMEQSPEAVGGSTAGEEKDPFLSLLEQLAEHESALGSGVSELDFFLAGTGGPSIS